MNSISEIVKWAVTDLSDWEADLVRRLLEDGVLTESATKQVVDNAIITFGINEGNEHKDCIAPFFEAEVTGDLPADDPIKLCSIHAVENVNAIDNGSALPFNHDGITLIYGENGSGKSGYTRILKSACFSKHVEPEILANVYKAHKGPQSAKISLLKNGERLVWDWSPGKSLADLLDINVYDAEAGKVLLEKSNQVTYKPKGAAIFDEVGDITEKIKNSLNERIKNIKLPEISDIEKTPAVDFWLKSINDETNPQDIKENISWVDENQIELEGLKVSIQENENGISAKKIEKIVDLLEKRVPRAIQKIKTCLAVVSDKKATEMANLEKSVTISKQAYDLAVAKLDIAEPLEGVHTEAWKALFKSAKEFSEKHAYTGKLFPNIEYDAHCVLCMQPLGEDAKDRLSRFESYIIDSSKKTYDEALRNIKVAHDEITALIVPDQDTYEPLCNDLIEIIGNDQRLGEIFCIIKARKKYFGVDVEKNNLYPSEEIDVDLLSQNLFSLLEQKKQELLQTISPEKHSSNLARHIQLQINYNLKKAEDKIFQYHQALIFNKKISVALNSIKTTKQKFSNKAKAIISQLVTPEFIENFKNELDFMGVSLAVKISPVVRDSDTSHSFSIATKRPGKVLSEGEQKVISLSAFLAEIKTFKNNSTIILDDPVSSLDHIYREKIAARLAKEGMTRQVIIFTHDLSLIMEIEGKCNDIALIYGKGPARSSLTIRRNGSDSGFCYSKAPWRGMSTSQRAQSLDEDLHSIKGLYESDVDTYNQRAALLYCLLREAWEALIEQDLFCQIVTRGRNSIQTLRLSDLSIEPTDANIITLQMTKTSNWMFGHDKSKALSENRPAPKEVLEDISNLRSFSKEIIARRKATTKEFDAQFVPPLSEVG